MLTLIYIINNIILQISNVYQFFIEIQPMQVLAANMRYAVTRKRRRKGLKAQKKVV